MKTLDCFIFLIFEEKESNLCAKERQRKRRQKNKKKEKRRRGEQRWSQKSKKNVYNNTNIIEKSDQKISRYGCHRRQERTNCEKENEENTKFWNKNSGGEITGLRRLLT